MPFGTGISDPIMTGSVKGPRQGKGPSAPADS